MNKIKPFVALCFGATMLLSCTAKIAGHTQSVNFFKPPAKSISSQPNTARLTLATWNVEHLAYPMDTGCRPRTTTEIEKLKAYALSLDADIVALQEVASVEAVEQLFAPEQWTIILSPRQDSESYACRGSKHSSSQQKLAFAVKKTLKISHVSAVAELALGHPGLRYGLEIEVQSDLGRLSVLNVHLKSGCFVDNLLRSEKEACELLSQQGTVLENWIDTKEKHGTTYAVLGDFNHRLTAPYNQLTQQITTNQEGKRRSIVNSGKNLIGCHPYYPAPIDHVFLGNLASSGIEYQTKLHHFDNMQADKMLSDHCAMSTVLSNSQHPLSYAVKWQIKSKEYQLITRGIYKLAENSLSELSLPNSPWVVVMDVDETVLDNSPYQAMLDKSGAAYSEQSWEHWVKTQQATLVPGASDFIQQVFAMGGKIALVTNREKYLDNDTWQNLSQLIPVTFENTCLTGRSFADKAAMTMQDIVNDKDMRRQQLTNGSINCFSTHTRDPLWQLPHIIVMQIGDNIEDIKGISQEHADIDVLLNQWNKNVFILPNPMYGSW